MFFFSFRFLSSSGRCFDEDDLHFLGQWKDHEFIFWPFTTLYFGFATRHFKRFTFKDVQHESVNSFLSTAVPKSNEIYEMYLLANHEYIMLNVAYPKWGTVSINKLLFEVDSYSRDQNHLPSLPCSTSQSTTQSSSTMILIRLIIPIPFPSQPASWAKAKGTAPAKGMPPKKSWQKCVQETRTSSNSSSTQGSR